MSIDPRNNLTLSCGIVADPEIINDKILKLRVAVDYAGSEKEDPSNKSGYFDVTYYLNSDNERNAKFVKSQVESGNMKKGSQIMLVGRIHQGSMCGDEVS